LKKILIVLLVAFLAIQFIRPAKNIQLVDQTKTATNLFQTPLSVKNILEVSCYDCHSNNTTYPWYSNLQPVMWFLTNHVNEGKNHLNFDDLGDYSLKKQHQKMEEIVEVLDKNEMPLTSYTIIHRDANLTAEQKEELVAWAKANMENMKPKHTEFN
jgi:hypothetical protein